MQKFLILFLILFIIFFNFSTKAYVAKNIDLKIKDNETSIVFLKLQNSRSLLIKDDENSNLFILDYQNDKNISETLKIFNSKPDIFYLKNHFNKTIDNIKIFTQNSTLKFRINNYTLCIYNNQKISNCDFVYLMKLDSEFEINKNLSVVFYDENIHQKYLKSVQESWIDSSMISIDSFTILELNEDSYNIIIVPSTNN